MCWLHIGGKLWVRHLHKPRGSQKAGQEWRLARAKTVPGDLSSQKGEDTREKRPKQYISTDTYN